VRITSLIQVIEKIAPPAMMESWDKSGVQTASARSEINHLAVMLEPSPANIAQAISLGADFLLAHHPLTLQPRLPDRLDDYHAALSLLFKADLPLYSAHTPLDCNPNGPARWLARKFDLRGTEILEKTGRIALSDLKGEQDYGLGFAGDLPEPLPYDEFCGRLALYAETSSWRGIGTKPALVSRLACCPGSGSDLADLAQTRGAEVFISGDVRYHTALSFKLHVIDLGHFQLEEIMMRECAAALARELPALRTSFIPGRDPFTFERI
jgi:dinuclear metal center YbgI/SA1388 family protein